MGFCEQCNKWVAQPEGKKKKRFCSETCRSNFWYAKNKKGKTESKIDYRQATPESFDGPKLPDNFTDDEPLSFAKLAAQIAPKQSTFRSFETYRQLILECESIDDYKPLKAEIQSAVNLTEKQKKLLLRT